VSTRTDAQASGLQEARIRRPGSDFFFSIRILPRFDSLRFVLVHSQEIAVGKGFVPGPGDTVTVHYSLYYKGDEIESSRYSLDPSLDHTLFCSQGGRKPNSSPGEKFSPIFPPFTASVGRAKDSPQSLLGSSTAPSPGPGL